MIPAIGFWSSFCVTLALLVTSLVSGLRGGRRVHLVTGPLTLVMLFVTIACTKILIRDYAFPEPQLSFHLKFAITAAVAALPVLLTGLWFLRCPRARLWHRIAVWTFVVTALSATGTGIWLFSYATLKAD
ncbi:MAG: hypothetical protein NT107_14240 [Planctomycetota bacterium]|nr:hypothetical protein [Planctomycetota bacterium]